MISSGSAMITSSVLALSCAETVLLISGLATAEKSFPGASADCSACSKYWVIQSFLRGSIGMLVDDFLDVSGAPDTERDFLLLLLPSVPTANPALPIAASFPTALDSCCALGLRLRD
ncbi:hypothetical protein BX661DRAFT_39587 [Kickxella alabastrina]|uniref:uncharacterized protein n=1 Tax=Kickxella alabastrina TaxID=61397 RepID=UPI0022208885|nr:uncharacterized protein BX661DRAFT_39587 [Kickxella alabastrina]KAI7825547.1 hypothetical protein BX661DRAFT_39587 [Kickxella alabastrina]